MTVKPLSWPEARLRLRQVLEAYLDDSYSSSSSSASKQSTSTIEIAATTDTTQKVCSLAQWAIDHNLDFYTGSLPLSIVLLALSIIYQFNVAACVVLLLGSIFSLWMFRRSTYLRSHDTEMRKKREVLKFLKSVKAMESEFGIKTGQMEMKLRDMPHLTGTALTDIYPVFRKLNGKISGANLSSSSFSSSLPAYWTRLPSLLLVQGDFIALQVGDVVPTKCCLVEYPTFHVMAGERLTLECLGETQADIAAELPRGRTTLPMDSENLLLVANKMQIFQVLDTPLDEFIKRPAAPSKPSQAWRQMNSVRKALFLLAPIFFLATAVILLIRPSITSSSGNSSSSGRSDLSMLIPLPFLAAIGLCPVVGPAFVFFLEVLGTARILTTVHPFASSTITTTTTTTAMTENRTAGGGSERVTDTAPQATNHAKLSPTQLLLSYNLAVVLSRLSLWWMVDSSRRIMDRWWEWVLGHRLEEQLPSRRLVRVPPASLNLLEKLGVATACTLVDDELACEPNAIPQQLLVPSGNGLKLLDLCPDYDDDDADHHSDEGTTDSVAARNQGRLYSDNEGDDDSDSDDSEDGATQRFHSTLRRKVLKRRIMRRRRRKKPKKRKNADTAAAGGGGGGGDAGDHDSSSSEGSADSDFEVQFEDPLWWQHLPSLKCIGLSCLIVDEAKTQSESSASFMDESIRSCRPQHNNAIPVPMESDIDAAVRSLVRLVCTEKRSKQLRALAECIGFSTEPNNSGPRGDISPFEERLRLQVLSSQLYCERLSGDAHERSSEQSRWWGLIRPDSTSVIVQDARTGAYQLLTIGDPLVVTSLCNEAWQGEISTILPLAAMDKQTIAETSKNWKLADLDVAAFSYAPVPHTLEARLKEEHLQGTHPTLYLLDHTSPHGQPSLHKDKAVSPDWALIRNQIFLGVLGALIVPRREIIKLLNTLSDAGVRFVYFSPRNMRRQKELASQMGIDVAWNCAISLRPLGRGEEDPHRMTSGYGDWDVNAKLPHGVEAVRHHLEEVDNVPLLVSLYTDATKARTKEMVEIFQQYSDTVVVVGLSHLPWNGDIFSVADIAVGIDVLNNVGTDSKDGGNNSPSAGSKMLAFELEFVSAISSHACAFRFVGAASLSHLSDIIEVGRAALAGSTAAAVFLVSSSLSFSFFALFSVCAPSTTIPFVPTLGAVVYLQIVLPLVGLAMAMTKSQEGTMKASKLGSERLFLY
jgi:hypothetical protein